MAYAYTLLLYSKIGRLSFDETRDALDFINTIELSTIMGYIDYQWILIIKLSIQATTWDWFMQSIQPYMDTITWREFKGQFFRFFYPPAMRDAYRWQFLHMSKGDKSVEDM